METPDQQAPQPAAAPVQPDRSWTVTMKDGTVYRGVKAPTAEAAGAKMTMQPQGPLGQSFLEQEHARIQGGMKDILMQAGRSEADAAKEAERVGKKIPGTWTDVIGAAIPAAVGALIPEGRTFSRVGGQVLGNIAGRGALEAGSAYMNNEDPLAAGIKGSLKGIVPGVVQGTVGALHGPTKDTLKVQQAVNAVKQSVSPNVAAVLDAEKPAALLSKTTVNAMKKAAGQNMDVMEGQVDANLGPRFQFMIQGKVGNPVPMNFQAVRQQIRELRDVGERQYQSPLMADKAAKAMRQAARMEEDMVRQMRAAGRNTEADMYQKAIGQYAQDSNVMRWVRGLQQSQSLFNNVNAQDNPALSAAQQALKPGGKAKAAMHGVLGAAEASIGRPIAAGYQLGRASDQWRGGPLNPAQSAPTQDLLRRLLSPSTMLGGAASGTQDYLLQPKPNE